MNDVPRRPPVWMLVLAFALIYLSWGTTYLAIRKGVETLPPCLFGGVRVLLAGLVLLGFLRLGGVSLRLSRRDFFWTAVVGLLMFVGGNGLITLGEIYVASGVASVLVATTPLGIACAELLLPAGERLRAVGWLGLLLGLGGVLLLLAPRVSTPESVFQDFGPLLILGSSLAWSVGSVLLRHKRANASPLAAAAYQMVVGGGSLTVIGLLAGEAGRLTPEQLTLSAVTAFFYLLVVGSLVGFVAFNWLLRHVSAALVGTYAYVNPIVAIAVGWLLNDEAVTGWTLGGMVVILSGVALVRAGRMPPVACGVATDVEPTSELHLEQIACECDG